MGRFDFVSPGAAAGDALRKLMVEREAQQRQDMLDRIALDREARLKEHDAASLANTQANTASLIAQRNATDADRTRTNNEQAADKVIRSHRMDEDVNDSEYATATKVPGLEGYFKPTVTQGAQTGEDANGVPQYDVKQGHKFAGSPEERKAAETRQKVDQALMAHPDLRKDPDLSMLMDIASANDKWEPVMNAIAKRVEQTTTTLFRTDPARKVLERFDEGTGQWVSHVGPIPKDHQILQEPANANGNGGRTYAVYGGDGVHIINSATGAEVRRYDNKLGETAQKDIVNTESLLNDIGELEKVYNPAWVGPLKGRYNTMALALVGEGDSQGLSDMSQILATLNNTIINLRTGAQMSEPEAQRIMKEVPNMNLPPDVFVARLNGVKRKMSDFLQRRADIGYGRRTAGGADAPKAGAGGKKAVGRYNPATGKTEPVN